MDGLMVNSSSSCPKGSRDKTKDWQMEMLMEKIRSKANQYKSFFESSKILRMTMLEKRYPIDAVERSQLQKCLDTLQQNIKVTTHQAMIERLESVSRQLGLKFVTGQSGYDLFISSDMFYLEIVLEVNGEVKDVKIHHEGRGEQQSCEELVCCLTRRDFTDFTAQLEGLASIYQLNAEKKVKSKAFTALTSLEADLTTLASLQTYMKDPITIVHNSPIGLLEKRRGGHAMKLTYFVSPYDLLDSTTRTTKTLSMEGVTVGQSVSVCMESSTAHKLQTAPLITISRGADGNGWPVYGNVTTSNSITVAGTFVLNLSKPMPICMSLINSIQAVTQAQCADATKAQPLLSLITQHASGGLTDSSNSKGLFVNVGDQQHCYLMTESRNLDGVLVSSVPFTHPSHVPQIITLLRQQALFNSVITSCIRPNTKQDVDKMIMLEVTPLSWQHLSISLEHPLEEGMATVELDLGDINNITCKVYTAGESGSANSDYATKVFQRCLSIPVTMRSLIKQWNQQSQRLTPVYNGIGGGGGGGSGGNGGGNNGSSSDYDPDLKIKLEPGLGSLVSRHHQGNFVSDQSLSDPGFENFSSPIEEQLSLGQFPDLASTSGKGANLLGLLESPKNTKRRKRRSGESWRSPKRKHEDGGTVDSSSSDSTPLGTPTSREPSDNRIPTPTSTTSGLEYSLGDLENSGAGEKSQSDLDNEETITEDAEDDDIFKTAVKKVKKSREEKKSASDIIFDLENKNLVPPSVSITPITSNQINTSNFNSVLSGMGLERRPGIEIIPISSTPTTSLPSSITITPITTKPVIEERSKDRKSSRSKSEDKGKQEKKRKRKREDSPMGPPEKVPPKPDPLSKPVTVSIKPADSSSSPRPSSPAGTVSRKYTSSPTHTSPLAIVGKSSPGSSSKSKPPPQQSPKHSPAYSTSSPKNNLTSSPKHGTSSPKHQSSSGKPSMSTLKSAVSSPSKSDSKTKSKEGRDKDRKSYSSSSGHSSPQLKSASVKLKQLDLSTIDVPQSLQSGGSTPPNSGDGGKPSAGQSRNRKSSISAVVDKLKSALHCGEEGNGKEKKEGKDRSTSGKVESKSTNKPGETKSGEYMVKPSSDGIKITINKTRTKESSKVKSSSSSSSSSTSSSSSSSSGNASPKMHTGLKSGVNSGPASKKPSLPGQKSGSPGLKTSSSSSLSSSSSAGKPLVKSGLSLQKSLKPSGSPKTSDPNRVRDKPRISKGPEKSVFSSSKSDARKLSPSALREDSDYKSLPTSSSQLVVEGLVKSLDTKFQIPKLSARNANASQSDDKKTKDSENRSSDSPKVLDLASKDVTKYGTGSKNSEDSRVSSTDSKTKPTSTSATITIGSSSPKLSSSKIGGDVADSPNISIIPVPSEKEEKDSKGNNVTTSGSHSGVEDVLSSLKMELPISALSFTACEPSPLPPPQESPPDESKKVVVCTTSQQEAAELLLDFSATSKIETRLLSMTDRAIGAIPLRRNTPPPPPPPAFPGSPSVSVHIVKSPAPPSDLPLVIQSPHSSSPCITDDELMDEALVASLGGIGK